MRSIKVNEYVYNKISNRNLVEQFGLACFGDCVIISIPENQLEDVHKLINTLIDLSLPFEYLA